MYLYEVVYKSLRVYISELVFGTNFIYYFRNNGIDFCAVCRALDLVYIILPFYCILTASGVQMFLWVMVVKVEEIW